MDEITQQKNSLEQSLKYQLQQQKKANETIAQHMQRISEKDYQI